MTVTVVPAPEQPVLVKAHAPSKLPRPPPTLLGRDRCVSSGGLCAGRSGLVSLDPDNDFSSFPMLPPALPDCASATRGLVTARSPAQNRAVVIRCRAALFIRIDLLTNYCELPFCRPAHRHSSHDNTATSPVLPHAATATEKRHELATSELIETPVPLPVRDHTAFPDNWSVSGSQVFHVIPDEKQLIWVNACE
jgi:hypothetical protein